MSIIVNNFCKSGNGDRLLDLFVLSIYALLEDKNLLIKWEDFNDNDNVKPSYRYIDTKLDYFTKFLKLPSYVTLQYETPIYNNNDILFDIYLGGEYSPEKFYNTFLDKKYSRSTFEEAVFKVRNNFGLLINNFEYAYKYVTVHLRRTDKLKGNHPASISLSRLEELDNKTISAIKYANRLGIEHFYIASDCYETKNKYIKILEELSLKVVNPDNTYNLLDSYFDYWIMKSSTFIIVSMKYSTFSLSNALLFNKILWTTIGDSIYEVFNFKNHVNIKNYNTEYINLNKIKMGVNYRFDVNIKDHKNRDQLSFLNDRFINWENDTFDIFNYVKCDGVVIDIGAWIGLTTIWLAKNFKTVIAIEADKISVIYLKNNLILSESINNVIVYDNAIYKENTEIIFGGATITNGELNTSSSQIKRNITYDTDYIVRTITLRDIINNSNIQVDTIKFIKCDIEGGEEFIIEELLEFCKNNRTALFISLHCSWWTTKTIDDLVNMLINYSDYLFTTNNYINYRSIDLLLDNIKHDPFMSIFIDFRQRI